MYENYAEFNLKKESRLHTKSYSLFSDDSTIGTVEEVADSSKVLKNYLAKLLQLFGIAKLDFKLFDAELYQLGRIIKERGLHKDLLLFSEEDEHLATLKPEVNTKSPVITVIDTNGNDLMKAEGNYGATDFSVFDCRKNIQIAYLKKRACEQTAIKEKRWKHGEYYNVTNNKQEGLATFILISMCLVLDLYSDY